MKVYEFGEEHARSFVMFQHNVSLGMSLGTVPFDNVVKRNRPHCHFTVKRTVTGSVCREWIVRDASPVLPGSVFT